MKRNVSFVISVSIFILILVALRASAEEQTETCRIDISMKDSAVFDQDLTAYIDDITSKGYKTVSVYGFASKDEEASVALARSQGGAEFIAKTSGGQIDAIPQFGVAGGTTDIFGPGAKNRRIIVTTNQLLQSEYLTGRTFGQYNPEECPPVFHCESAKLFKSDWYCLKKENNADVWYGPCENKGCIGDTDFTIVPKRRQTELNNVIGDDPVSINKRIEELIKLGNFQKMDGSALKATESFQEALELSLKIEPDDRIENISIITDSRDIAFSTSIKTAQSEKEAKKALSLVRRSEKLSPDYPLILNPEKKAMLGSIKDPVSNTAYYTIVVLLTIIAIFVLASLVHLVLHTRRAHLIAHEKVLDENAEEIIDDIEELELSFKKKSMLVEDSIYKIKSLK